MAIRKLRFNEDPILHKKTRKIEKIDDRIKQLRDDMLETMYAEEGVGLAAPQVGILKRMCVIDIGEGPTTFINPVITKKNGSIIEEEACLSFPDQSGPVERPETIKVEYTTIKGERYQMECSELMARAVCHELDHLDGIVFLDRLYEGEWSPESEKA